MEEKEVKLMKGNEAIAHADVAPTAISATRLLHKAKSLKP